MRFNRDWRAAIFGGVIAIAIVMTAACGGGGGNSIAPQPRSAPQVPMAVSTSIPLTDIGSAIPLPSVAGYAESITLTSNSAPVGTLLNLGITSAVPKGLPPMPADFKATQGFLYFTISSSATVTLAGFPGFSLRLPPGVHWDGGTLHLGFYNPAAGWQEIGDVMLAGGAMTFSPTRTPLTLKAGITYVVVPFACTGPSPSPSPVSTIVPLVTATPLPIPPLGGFAGDFVVASNDAPSGTTVTITTYLSPPPGAPSPEAVTHHPLFVRPPVNGVAYVKVQYNSGGGKDASAAGTITFSRYPAVEFDLPEGFETGGLTFNLETFDLESGKLLDNEIGTLSGAGPQSVSFPGTDTPFAATIGNNYLWELVSQASASPSPSPSPSLSPTPTPSPSPSPTVPIGTIAEYTVPTPAGTPYNIVTGPDGALWYTSLNGHEVSRVSKTGSFSVFSVPDSGTTQAISVGPDGKLWFGGRAATIYQMTTTGTLNSYTVCSGNGGGITSTVAGPDGNIWFTTADTLGSTCDNIGMVTPAGDNKEYPSGASFPDLTVGVLSGPDGNLWYVYNAGTSTSFCKMNTGGSIVACYPFAFIGTPTAMAVGPDGNLWYTGGNNQVCKLTTLTDSCYTTPTTFADPTGIASGPDGALWFTEPVANNIGRVTTSGTITEYSLPNPGSAPYYITKGPDGNMWFTEKAGRIGKITP